MGEEKHEESAGGEEDRVSKQRAQSVFENGVGGGVAMDAGISFVVM